MKTDIITITPAGEGITDALAETEKAAAFRGLDRKQTLRLRLLAEEMTGMLRTIVGEKPLKYWVESNGNAFSLHLSANAQADYEMREVLLKTSTSGKNAAAKGFMGRIRDIFMRLSETSDVNALSAEYGYSYVGVVGYDASTDMSPNAMLYGWSLSAYREAVEANRNEEPEKWDELEKSITAKLADEVRIFIRLNTVEMVIEKTF
ncbi:MAG: hypothetical protein IJL62_04405 [Clostridia bacterium]|nr:hypothetical protein [Clostridia bacterium]